MHSEVAAQGHHSIERINFWFLVKAARLNARRRTRDCVASESKRKGNHDRKESTKTTRNNNEDEMGRNGTEEITIQHD